MDSSSSSKIACQDSAKIQLKASQVSQPQKDQDKPSQVTQLVQRKLKPEWLEKFFKRTFFDHCSKHRIHRNDLNKYCIDCDAPLCQYCLSLAPHSSHRILKIYRHVYENVVPLVQIVRHIDCSKIQPYKCNKQMVIALSPLPHNGSGRTSKEATCLTCKRKLIEYDYKYCSITCKVAAFKKKKSDSAPPFLLLDENKQNPEESSSKMTFKRKGTPFLLLDRKEQNTEAESSSKKTLKRKRAPFLSLDQEEQNTEAESSSKKTLERKGTPFMLPDRKEQNIEAESSSKRTRKRKGMPHRAPFY